jgi:hypothetical protein
MLAEARESKLVGTELTLASLIDVHIAILAKDQTKVAKLLDQLPTDSQFSGGLLQYSHYLALLNNPKVILTEEATKDFLAGSAEFHDVWSAIVKLTLERLGTDTARLGGSGFEQLMASVVEDPLNDWFETVGYTGIPDYAGDYAFSGIFATPQAHADGVMRVSVDSKGVLTGSIEIPTEKVTFKLSGTVDSVGRLSGSFSFDDGTSASIRGTLLPKKALDKLGVGRVPEMKFIVNSSNPAGVMFVVTSKGP